MRDAVADVLAQRARIGTGGARRGLAASLIAHAVLFTLIFFGARQPLRQPAPNVVNIRFAPSPIQAPAQAARPAAPPAAETTPAPAPAVKAAPAPPPPTKTETPPATKKEAYAPKQESLFGRSDRKVAPPESKAAPVDTKAAPAPAETKAPPAAAGTGDAGFATPAIGTAGVTGLEGGEFPYTIYVNQMVNKIGSNWLRPQTSGEPLAEVYFVIERDGSIRDAKVSKPSGSPPFDRAALRAVLSSSPLAPLPFGYSGTWLGVRLTFH